MASYILLNLLEHQCQAFSHLNRFSLEKVQYVIRQTAKLRRSSPALNIQCFRYFIFVCINNSNSVCECLESDIAQSVGAQPSELEGHQFDPRQSIDVCFEFPLFHVVVALNTRKNGALTEEGGVRSAHRGPQVLQSSCTITCHPHKIRTFTLPLSDV